MSSFLSRRVLHHRSEATQPLIAFQLQQVWFALPIQVAQRVVPLRQVHGQLSNGSLSLTRYRDQEIVVLDIRSRVFSNPLPPALPSAAGESVVQPHLLVIDYWEGELLGIRLDNPPVLRRAPLSAFAPVSPTYLIERGIRCVSAVVTLRDSEPLFFLNLEQLLQGRFVRSATPQESLPAAPSS